MRLKKCSHIAFIKITPVDAFNRSMTCMYVEEFWQLILQDSFGQDRIDYHIKNCQRIWVDTHRVNLIFAFTLIHYINVQQLYSLLTLLCY